MRSAPAPEGAEPALFVHGLGGSATNWTDLMDLLRKPPADRPDEPALACEAVDLPGLRLLAGPGGSGSGSATPSTPWPAPSAT